MCEVIGSNLGAINEKKKKITAYTKQTENNLQWLIFWFNFFDLLTYWLGGKLESLLSLLKVYQVYPEFTKKRFYTRVNSERVSELINS